MTDKLEIEDIERPEIKTACVFTGQGSQFVGMGKQMVANHPIAARTFEEANDVLGFNLKQMCFEGSLETLTLTAHAQPALLTHSTALFRVLKETGDVNPVCVAGHSLGEYSALVAAEALEFADALKAVHLRGKWMQEAVPTGTGGMLALVGIEEAEAQQFCDEVLKACAHTLDLGPRAVFSVANLNGGGQVVVAGHASVCQWAAAHVSELTVKPRRVVPLNVSAPFHCALMTPAEEKLGAHLKTLRVSRPRYPYFANVDAKRYTEADGIVERLTRQASSPVRWEKTVQNMLSGKDTIQRVWEIGPGQVLAGLVKRIAKEIQPTLEIQAKGGEYDA